MGVYTKGLYKGEEIMTQVGEGRWADRYNDVFITVRRLGKYTVSYEVSERRPGNEHVVWASFAGAKKFKAWALAERLAERN